MKTLIIYFSRTGMTRKVAENLKIKLNADIEEIKDPTDRAGVMGYFRCGKESMKKILAPIEDIKSDLTAYDLVIIGTPIWGWNMSSPIRAFATRYADRLPRIAVFCTQGGSGADKAVAEIETLVGKKSLSSVAINNKEMNTGQFETKLEKFIKDIGY